MQNKRNLTFKIKKLLITVSFQSLVLISEMKLSGQIQNMFNHKAILEYEDITDDFANLLELNNIHEPLDVFENYNYALWGGYLSENHQFQFSSSRDLFLNYSGLECISGTGVCLNIADMLTDTFRKLGYNANTVMCYVNLNGVRIEYIHNNEFINRNVDDSESAVLSFLISNLGYVTGNHAITCVEENGEYYYFDPTNLIYLNKESINRIRIINGEGSFYLRYFSSLIYNDFNSIKGFFSKNDTSYEKEIYDKKNIDIPVLGLEQFYLEHEHQYSIISDDINSKSQILCLTLPTTIILCITTSILKKLRTAYYKDFIGDYALLMKHILSFLEEYNIKEDNDYVNNLYRMLESGCLSYKKGSQEYSRKLSFVPDIGQEFLFDSNYFKGEIICKILNMCGYQTFYINTICKSNLKIKKIIGSKKENEIHFYDCDRNAILLKIENNILIDLSSKDQYKIIKIKSNFIQKKEVEDFKTGSIINPNVIIPLEDFNVFYEKNENLIDNIAKQMVKRKNYYV